jgi:hypothetical protein
MGIRWLTIALVFLGFSIACYGAWSSRFDPQPRDKVWLAMSGILGGSIVLLICLAPGLLNNRWDIDRTIPKPDPNELMVVPREKAMQKGRLSTKDEVLDSATEAFRQDDVVIRIESAKIGQVPGKGEKPYFQLLFRVVNTGHGQSIPLEGFSEYQPVLSDQAGHSFAFIEQRLKQIKNRAVVYESWNGRQSIEIGVRGSQDVMLIFESPPAGETLKLEVNSAAWGRKGMCRFRIAGINPSIW